MSFYDDYMRRGDNTPLLTFDPFEVQHFAVSPPTYSTVMSGDVVGGWVHWILVLFYLYGVYQVVSLYFLNTINGVFFRELRHTSAMSQSHKGVFVVFVIMFFHYLNLSIDGVINVPWLLFFLTALFGFYTSGRVETAEEIFLQQGENVKQIKSRYFDAYHRSNPQRSTSSNKTKNSHQHDDFDQF